MEKQIAVDWLAEIIRFANKELYAEMFEEIKQAKQIEKEQIVEAFYQGVDQESDTHGAMNLDRKDAENYYNETFKTKQL